jgi:two-component system C4-dicarboxylate transport response regulator DctD
MPTRLLLVDDDAATLLGLGDALERHLSDIEIHRASSAERALILMALDRFDVILTDVRMPGMNGLTFLKEIKARRPETLVVVMTGHADGCREEALRLGAWSFYEKPLDIPDLVASLRRAVNDAALVRALHDRNQQSKIYNQFKSAS